MHTLQDIRPTILSKISLATPDREKHLLKKRDLHVMGFVSPVMLAVVLETAEAIIKSNYWEEALRNCTIDRNTGRYDTPMRKLIRKMPDVAESVFNRCVVPNKEHVQNEKYEITFNYEFLDDTYYIHDWTKKGSSDSGPSSGSLFDDDIHLTHKAPPYYSSDSRTFKRNHPLMIMVTSKRVDLLVHPLAAALLRHKWIMFAKNYTWFHYTAYIVFLVFMTGYMLSTDPPYGQAKSCNDADAADFKQNRFAAIGKNVIIAVVVWNLLIEVFHIVQARMNYISWEKLIEWITNITALLTVIDFESCQRSTGFRTEWQWNVGTVAIFLTWINLILLYSTTTTYGIYIVMLKHILKTFFDFVRVFVVFIVAFAMAFYALLQNQPAFETIWQALIKTTVMMTGEFEYTSIFIDNSTQPVEHVNYKPVSYIIFVIFMVIMSTIIMNLFVGLAVDSIKEVQEHAEFYRNALLVEWVLDVERVVPNYFRRKFIKKHDEILPNVLTLSKIFGLESYGHHAANINTALNSELLKKSVDKMKLNLKEMKASNLNLEGMMKTLLEANKIRLPDIQINQSTAQGVRRPSTIAS